MRRHLPSLNGLRAFEAAARHLSFTAAAQELNVTQTAISHQIKALEARLGVTLFVRRNRQLLLSEAGQAYFPGVREGFDKLHESTERLLQKDTSGPLTVTTTASFATKWLMPRLGGFQEKHPEIDVRISTTLGLVDFARDDVDVGIRYGRGNWPGLQSEWLIAEDIFPVCSPSLLNVPKKPLKKPEDLSHHTLLTVTIYRDDWPVWLTAANVQGVDTSRALRVDLPLAAIQAAVDGVGVALGRRPLIDADLKAGRLVVPFDISIPSDNAYYIVAPAESFRRKKIKAFRDWLLSVVREEQAAKPPAARTRKAA